MAPMAAIERPDWRSALLSPQGRALVERLTPYDPDRALTVLAAIRRDPLWADQPDVVAAAATQARLRTRAAARFPGAPRWWTADGLEQATRPAVARRHAARYARAGIDHVLDLCCGVGSDALAFAAAGLRVTAVDLDPEALWALRATADDWGLAVTVRLGDVRDALAGPGAAGAGAPGAGCFVDPARRRGGVRALAPDAWSPPWSWVRSLAGAFPATGAKVAPGIPHGAIPAGAQAEWVSVDGDLVEAGVWWGPLRAGSAGRVATLLRSDGSETTLDDTTGVPAPEVGPIGRWLVEPDAAVIRAGLVSVVAAAIGGRLVDPRIAYVTSDAQPPATPLHATFEVLDEVPFARRAMRGWLRERGYGNVVVKKRGVDVIPEQLRTQMRLTGDGPTATLVLTRTAAGPVAWAVRPA